MGSLTVEIKRLPQATDLSLPAYQTSGAAGMDILAALDAGRSLATGTIELIRTGLIVAIPAGWEAQVRPGSGLATRHGITLPNSPATEIKATERDESGFGHTGTR